MEMPRRIIVVELDPSSSLSCVPLSTPGPKFIIGRFDGKVEGVEVDLTVVSSDVIK